MYTHCITHACTYAHMGGFQELEIAERRLLNWVETRDALREEKEREKRMQEEVCV